MEQEKEVYVDSKGASKMLVVGKQTLCNWRSTQRGPRYVKMGRAVRYALSDLVEFMEARLVGTGDQPKEQS